MSSHEPALGDADTAQTASRNHVIVTGAGFTRALVPRAPLLIDDFNNDVLEDKARGLPFASRLLDWERSLHPQGHIDVERLMTRLDALMPYDYAENAGNAANEYGFLLSELKRAFLERLHEARKGDIHGEELKRFAWDVARVRTHLMGASGASVNVSHDATCRPIYRASMNRPTIAMRGSRPL